MLAIILLASSGIPLRKGTDFVYEMTLISSSVDQVRPQGHQLKKQVRRERTNFSAVQK
jgi:hypothetical protein